MKTSRGEAIMSLFVAHMIKIIVITFGTFLWIESRIPSFFSTKAPSSAEQSEGLGLYSTQAQMNKLT